MGLFANFFNQKPKNNKTDNRRLIELLDACSKNNTPDTRQNVFLELLNGNSFLIVQTKNDSIILPDSSNIGNDVKITVASAVNMDGLIVLGAFTDEQALLNWTKQPTEYTSMKSQAVLKFCEEQGIGRIVINTGLPNMYILERNRQNMQDYKIEKVTDVQVGAPKFPLSDTIIEKLIGEFIKVDTILEVYQYGQKKDNEFSIVLGFKISVNSDNAKKASIYAVENALQNQTLTQPLDLFFIETEDWYSTVKGINNSLLYKKL